MRPGATFAEVLDETLAAAPRKAHETCGVGGIRTLPIFELRLHDATIGRRRWCAGANGYSSYADNLEASERDMPETVKSPRPAESHRAAQPARVFEGRVRPVRRPKRSYSEAQRRAFEDIIRLGAVIDADFTDAELRSAFRTLARRYHPDRHPRSSEAEKARLAAAFVHLRETYALLQGTTTAAART